MWYLALCILTNAFVFLVFRAYKVYNIPTFQAIIVNYWVCSLVGLVFIKMQFGFPEGGIIQQPFLPFALVIGVFFVYTFTLIARTTQVFNVAVSSIATKISLVIPVVFSLFIFQYRSKIFDIWNYGGILFTIMAVILISYNPREQQVGHIPKKKILWLLPISCFLLGGGLDTGLNFTNYHYINTASLSATFPWVIFLFAALTGTIHLLVTRMPLSRKSIWGGILLGVPNYFSIYFALLTLTWMENDGAMFYPIINMGIILFSTLFSMLLFKERLSRVNFIGLGLSLLAIGMLSYQEIQAFWGKVF